MSTLAVVEEILREVKRPVSVREIVEFAGERLPTKSKTPDTVVARDLSMDIKRRGEASIFARTAPGRYTMREFVVGRERTSETISAPGTTSMAGAAIADGRAPTRAARTSEDAQPMVHSHSHAHAHEG